MNNQEAIRILNCVLEEWVIDDDVSIPREEALRLAINALSEPFINKPCISEGVCHEDKIKMIEDIKAEIKELDNKVCRQWLIEDIDKEVHRTYQECLGIIDKHIYKVREWE